MIRYVRHLLLATLLLAASVAPSLAQFASQATYAGTSGGSANAQTITVANASSYADLLGVPVRFLPGASNTGAATLNVSSLGAKAIKKPSTTGPAALTGGEMVTGSPPQAVEVMYDGTEFILLSNLNAVAQTIAPTPQGYLTPCSATATVSGCTTGQLSPTGNVTVTVLYYTPDTGNQIPIWNGTSLAVLQFSELTLTLGSSNVANAIYDVCVTTTAGGVYSANGVATVVTGPAWSNSTAGSGSRGTGAGSAQISRQNGLWVNAVAISGLNGASTYSIPAQACTVIGTILIDSVNGQVTFNRVAGQTVKWAAWNFFNRLPLSIRVTDPTTSWINSGGNFSNRPSNNNSANNATALTGLAEEVVHASFTENSSCVPNNGSCTNTFSIGVNSTSVSSGISALFFFNDASPNASRSSVVASYDIPPAIGSNVVTPLESVTDSTVNNTLIYGGSLMGLVLNWQG